MFTRSFFYVPFFYLFFWVQFQHSVRTLWKDRKGVLGLSPRKKKLKLVHFCAKKTPKNWHYWKHKIKGKLLRLTPSKFQRNSGGRVVKLLACGARGPGFATWISVVSKSPRQSAVSVKLRAPVHGALRRRPIVWTISRLEFQRLVISCCHVAIWLNTTKAT